MVESRAASSGSEFAGWVTASDMTVEEYEQFKVMLVKILCNILCTLLVISLLNKSAAGKKKTTYI